MSPRPHRKDSIASQETVPPDVGEAPPSLPPRKELSASSYDRLRRHHSRLEESLLRVIMGCDAMSQRLDRLEEAQSMQMQTKRLDVLKEHLDTQGKKATERIQQVVEAFRVVKEGQAPDEGVIQEDVPADTVEVEGRLGSLDAMLAQLLEVTKEQGENLASFKAAQKREVGLLWESLRRHTHDIDLSALLRDGEIATAGASRLELLPTTYKVQPPAVAVEGGSWLPSAVSPTGGRSTSSPVSSQTVAPPSVQQGLSPPSMVREPSTMAHEDATPPRRAVAQPPGGHVAAAPWLPPGSSGGQMPTTVARFPAGYEAMWVNQASMGLQPGAVSPVAPLPLSPLTPLTPLAPLACGSASGGMASQPPPPAVLSAGVVPAGIPLWPPLGTGVVRSPSAGVLTQVGGIAGYAPPS